MAQDLKKTLILVRHAHRDTSDKNADNGLSDRGKKQAKIFSDTIEKMHKKSKPLFLSSPKQRCVETLEPLAEFFDVKIKVHPELDEQADHETPSQFKKRVVRFVTEWKNDFPELTIACSHGDWLPFAVEELIGVTADFEKGGWAEFSFVDDEVHLQLRS